ncbi:exodeoxyribonuclease VII large subunit [Rickettsiella endosymbiont of Dermanyssus gallinae]|uniref:exodeoxyribonuclease VII large subunit n=1 Tax=Rickettsiella endosymbiont of Dermanyssus gallinae TaxID=2856608 RepID=UPI001C534014|nr:exodeoxyribonuclease VII large subunit [Rickettsiella endosymbiont of Dermanyssus gallinae]
MTINLSERKKSALSSEDVIYSISELNQMVQDLLEDAFLPLWIEGEISNFACPSSGHWYFSLKDKNAQVRCALFQGRHRYKDLQPKDGMQVLVRAKISLYPARGEFQLIVDQMELAGEGALRKAFEQLKAKLATEGLFENCHKKSLPKFPKTIGVITSETGAALRDICVILKRRFASIAIIIYPCLVQGKTAATQIAAQIQCANQRQECDVLILARGGGSLEDLWCFNEESVARAIFNSQLPLISAIGHETDFTIADFVADHRAATPSMAAQLASPDMQEYQPLLIKSMQRLINSIRHIINRYHQQLENLGKRLRHPRQRLQDNAQRLDDLTQRLTLNMKTQLEMRQQKLSGLSRTLHAVSPLASLARGYAVIKHVKTKQIIREISDVTIGDQVVAEIANGKLLCQVEDLLD